MLAIIEGKKCYHLPICEDDIHSLSLVMTCIGAGSAAVVGEGLLIHVINSYYEKVEAGFKLSKRIPYHKVSKFHNIDDFRSHTQKKSVPVPRSFFVGNDWINNTHFSLVEMFFTQLNVTKIIIIDCPLKETNREVMNELINDIRSFAVSTMNDLKKTLSEALFDGIMLEGFEDTFSREVKKYIRYRRTRLVGENELSEIKNTLRRFKILSRFVLYRNKLSYFYSVPSFDYRLNRRKLTTDMGVEAIKDIVDNLEPYFNKTLFGTPNEVDTHNVLQLVHQIDSQFDLSGEE